MKELWAEISRRKVATKEVRNISGTRNRNGFAIPMQICYASFSSPELRGFFQIASIVALVTAKILLSFLIGFYAWRFISG